MEEKRSWINTIRPYDLEPLDSKGIYTKKLFITPQYEEIDSAVPRILLTPLAHQKVTVKAMLDVEKKQTCEIMISGDQSKNYSKTFIETRAAVLSEHPGSGKTLEILMLIALNPVLDRRAELTSLPFPRCIDVYHRRFNGILEFRNMGYSMEVRKTYNKIYPQTVIFVGRSVLSQWLDTIQEHTDFSVFTIGDIFSLRTFYDMCFKPSKKLENKLSDFEIILVKNGNISGKFDVPELKGTPLEHTKSRPILNIFGELFKNVCFNRIVLDDFDYLSIPTTAKVIPSLFHWFVSATKRTPPVKRSPQQIYNIQDMLESYRPYYASTWSNRELFTFFNIGCEDEFIDESTSASIVHYYVYKFNNPNDNYIGLLGAMGTSESNNIMEMLNGDAVGEAMKASGSESCSVADIFAKILDNKWSIYKKALSIVRYISHVRKFVDELPVLTDPKKSISSVNLDSLKRNIKKPGPLTQAKTAVKYKQTSVISLIKEVEDENNVVKEENGKAIQRVKDNLKQGECPITCEPLSEVQSIVIMKCCGVVISSEAVTWALKMQSAGSNSVKGTCPNCRSQVGFDGLIFIDRDTVNFDNLLEEDNALEPEPVASININGLDVVDGDDAEDDSEDEPEDEPEEMNKYNCIINIIKGIPVEEKESRTDIKIPNLLVGNHDKGEASSDQKKVLIFANFRETMKLIEKKLVKNGIPYLKIQGTPMQIKDTVMRYNLPSDDEESINVLLINGPKFVAGLNLQVTTDLIFTGKVMDANVESQIGGRICRVGRKCNANIHYVLYTNEYFYMFGHGGKRPWEN